MADLILHRQGLTRDTGGHAELRALEPGRLAIIVCDMWDRHWSRGASERVDEMVPRMNGVLLTARSRGVSIIHAPSDTLGFYADHPARRRMIGIDPLAPPPDQLHSEPPLPIDDSDEGSDTGELEARRAWSRQHPGLEIDPERDLISDSGCEMYSYLRHSGIDLALIMGVHTNMCVLNRSFGIKQMVRWAVPIALVSDLTDAMYNPAKSPYVSHAEGTRLVVAYIEKFWCPTLSSQELIGALA